MSPRSTPRVLLALAGLLFAPLRLEAQEPAPPSAAGAFDELAARDARLTFTPASAERARALLAAAPPDVKQRAVAVMALGASRSLADLASIESIAADGQPTERGAALLALGELGSEGRPALEKLLRAETAGIEEMLVLALIHGLGRGGAECVERLETLAQDDTELALFARLYAEYARGESPGGPVPGLELYYELRWSAARAFGFVDGKRWQRCLLDQLLTSEEFLDRVVLSAAVDLERGSVRDHLVEILLEGHRPGALRAAAIAMPDELARAIRYGEWRPASSEEWRAMLEEIERRRTERSAEELLALAFHEVPEVEGLAGRLLLRAGGELPWRWVGDQLVAGTPQSRAALVEACGDRNDPERIGDLVDLLQKRPELGILGEGIVALARLGHDPARDSLRSSVKAPPSTERSSVLHALSRVLHDRRMLPYAEQALALEDLEPDLRFELELGFALNGRSRAREKLRETLPAVSEHPRRMDVVRALARGAEASDLALLRELFPVEEDLELNVELALLLVRQREPAAASILRAALWNDSWNRSVLAGGLIARGSGIEGLMSEVDTPPPQATERDLRRVGFAVGEWGGISAVESLARTRKEGDPALQGALLGALSTRRR